MVITFTWFSSLLICFKCCNKLTAPLIRFNFSLFVSFLNDSEILLVKLAFLLFLLWCKASTCCSCAFMFTYKYTHTLHIACELCELGILAANVVFRILSNVEHWLCIFDWHVHTAPQKHTKQLYQIEKRPLHYALCQFAVTNRKHRSWYVHSHGTHPNSVVEVNIAINKTNPNFIDYKEIH